MIEDFLKDIVMQFGGAALFICIIVGEIIKPLIPKSDRKFVCRALVVVISMVVAMGIAIYQMEPVSWVTLGKGFGFCTLSFLFYDLGAYSKIKSIMRNKLAGGRS